MKKSNILKIMIPVMLLLLSTLQVSGKVIVNKTFVNIDNDGESEPMNKIKARGVEGTVNLEAGFVYNDGDNKCLEDNVEGYSVIDSQVA